MPTCKICGKFFKRKDTRSRKTCGNEDCQRKWKNAQAAKLKGREPFVPRMVDCPECGEPFLQKQSNQTICPKHSCKAAHKRRMARERYTPQRKAKPKPEIPRTVYETRFCANCGAPFRTHGLSREKYCSPWCKELREERIEMAAYLATVVDPFDGMYTLPPGCRSWTESIMMPVI